MAQTTIENDALAVRRLSDDIIQFRTSHHLPDDLESSTFENFVLFLKTFYFVNNSDWCH